MADCKCDGAAVLSYGSTLEVQNPATDEWLCVGGLTDFNGPQTSRGEIDTTTLCSSAKEYALDLKDLGTFTSTMQTRYGDPAQQVLLANMDSPDTLNFRLTLPDDGFGNGQVVLSFKGRVQSFPVQGSMGQVISTSLSIRITGDVDFDFPASLGTHLAYSTFVLNEAADNDGAVSGVISVVLSGDTFAGADGDEITAATFTGTPAGLAPHVQKINATTAVINFSGNATNHAREDKAQIALSFLDGAFATGPASVINGATNRQITINFVS